MWLNYISTHPLVQAFLMSWTGVIICVAMVAYMHYRERRLELEVLERKAEMRKAETKDSFTKLLARALNEPPAKPSNRLVWGPPKRGRGRPSKRARQS